MRFLRSSLLFAVFSAPDLAITQVMVETLSVILFVLVFLRLPPSMVQDPKARRGRDLFVALVAGTIMGLLVLAAASVSLEPDLAHYFAQVSAPLAHGRNVVNVILVDFRSIDTMGEITVVAVAGVGVYALLRHGFRKPTRDSS